MFNFTFFLLSFSQVMFQFAIKFKRKLNIDPILILRLLLRLNQREEK